MKASLGTECLKTVKNLSITKIRHKRRESCCVTVDHDIYIIGGISDNNAVTNSVEMYRNTLFVSDEENTAEDITNNNDNENVNNENKIAPMNKPRASAEAVYRKEFS